jgi:hypothetical protein
MSGAQQSTQTTGTQPSEIDWEAMEPEYLRNIKSLRQLAGEYGCSDGAIRKHFNKLGIKRDPKKKVRAKAEQKVRREEAVRADKRRKHHSDRNDIEVAATVQADAIMRHRHGVRERMRLADKIFHQINDLVSDKTLLPRILEALENNEAKAYAKLLDRVSSLPEAVKMFDKMMQSYRVGVTMEREALGITDEEGAENPLTVFLTSLSGKALVPKTAQQDEADQ